MVDKFIPGALAVMSVLYLAGQALYPTSAPSDTARARTEPEPRTEISTARRDRTDRELLAATDAMFDVQTEIVGVLVRLAKRAGVPTADLEIAVEEGSSATTGDSPAPSESADPPATSSDPPGASDPDDPVPVPLPTPSPSPTACDVEVGPICVGLESGNPTPQP